MEGFLHQALSRALRFRRVRTTGGSASYSIPATDLGMRSETSAMQAQPEILLKRYHPITGWGQEKRLVPPIYYRHVEGTNFTRIELFDEATLISQREGKLSWGAGESVSPGDLLGYGRSGGTMAPIYAGQGEKGKLYNRNGELVGYRLGSRLGAN